MTGHGERPPPHHMKQEGGIRTKCGDHAMTRARANAAFEYTSVSSQRYKHLRAAL